MDVPITTADKQQTLKIVGRMIDKLEIQFSTDTKTVQYRIRPVVVQDLHVSVLLSMNDLTRLKAVVKCHEKCVYFSDTDMTMPLVAAPIIGAVASLRYGLTIDPGTECVFPVSLDDGSVGEEVLLEPLDRLAEVFSIAACPTIDIISDSKEVRMRCINFSDHPIKIPVGTKVGTAMSFGDMPTPAVAAVMSVNAPPLPNKAGDASKRAGDAHSTRWRDLCDRLWKDLGMDKPEVKLTKEEKQQVVELFAEKREALTLSPEEVGSVPKAEIGIDTGDAKPIKAKCRPLAPHLHKPLEEQIQKWLSQGVVSPGSGPWASPLVPVRKKDGGWRFAIDYRKLNAVTKKDARPVANMIERLSQLKSSPEKPIKYWASLDLSEAFHCVKIKEEDQDKSAVITPLGLFKFNRMSFGLAAAPQAFHAVVQLLEKGLVERDPQLGQTILMYFDDAVMGASTFQELLVKLTLFLDEVISLKLKVKPSKCAIGYQKLKWLGHMISEGGIQPDPDLVRTVKEWPAPNSLKEVRALHGTLSYFRKFIRNFSARCHHIRTLMKKNPGDKIEWTPEMQKELTDLANELTRSPILGHPDFTEDANPFIITCDTSGKGIGSTLSQR
jgi:hypothetical protein